MHTAHKKNTIRYFLLVSIFLAFLFFTTDFGLIDIQKTAIVLAAGIDRENDNFIVTSQISIPKSSDQGQSATTVQIVSRGNTVAQAFEEINAKTGWYPKLVFCNLILLGEETAKQDVFAALDYFLLDEYLSDNCLVSTCDGKAADLLNTTALIEDASSAAIGKILSNHAERVGTVYPSTLRTFAMGYAADDACGTLPIIKLQNQQEPKGENAQNSQQNGPTQPQNSGGNGQSGASQPNAEQNKPVFSAEETALFKHGKRVGTLTAEETFAANAVLSKLRLAPYSIATENAACTLTIKRNAPKIQLKVAKNGSATLKIGLTLTAGILDYAKAVSPNALADVGDLPAGAFSAAQKKLSGEILSLFEKTRALDCDLFRVADRYRKTGENRRQPPSNDLLKNTIAEVEVHFQNVR